MKNLKDYIAESVPLLQNKINIIISSSDVEKMRDMWKNIAQSTQLNYLNNRFISLKTDQDKRGFIEWINNSVFDFQWKIKAVSPMTYELFYLPQENDIKPSEYVKNVLKRLQNQCNNNCGDVAICCSIKEETSIKESLSIKHQSNLKKYFASNNWSNVVKDFNNFKKIVEDIIKYVEKNEWLNANDYEFNYKYSMLGDVISNVLEKYKIDDKTDSDYFEHFEDLLEYLTDYFEI